MEGHGPGGTDAAGHLPLGSTVCPLFRTRDLQGHGCGSLKRTLRRTMISGHQYDNVTYFYIFIYIIQYIYIYIIVMRLCFYVFVMHFDS